MRRIQAVCWDFDGVIADTENAHIAAWERTFADMGLDVAPDVCERAVEQDDRTFLTDVLVEHKILDGDIDGWMLHKQELIAAMLRESPRIYPGVVETVDRLIARGVRSAIVTTTWRTNVTTVLEAAKIADRFAPIVAKEDVRALKPDPEAYALALKRLKLSADEAIALEDSPSGISAARRRPANDRDRPATTAGRVVQTGRPVSSRLCRYRLGKRHRFAL